MSHLLNQVLSAKSFFRARTSLPSGETVALNSLQESFAIGLVGSSNAIPQVSIAHAIALNDALKDPPHGEENTAKIAAAIDARLQKPHLQKGRKALVERGSQVMLEPWHFPVQEEWDIILNKQKNWMLKMSLMIEVMNKVVAPTLRSKP